MSNRAQGGAPRRIDPQNPPYPQLRALLRSVYNAKTLTRLAQHQGFSELQYRIGLNDDLDDLIDEVFELARTRLMWEELLNAIADESPRHYNELAARLGWPTVDVPPPAPVNDSASKPEVPTLPEQRPERGEVEIHIADRTGDGYRIHLRAPTGQVDSILVPPWTPEQQERLLFALEEQGATLEAFVQDEMRPGDANALVPIGRKLFSALFPEHVETRYKIAVDTPPGIRLRLRIDPPEMQALPWELLYDDERHQFLALFDKSLITRFLAVAYGHPPLTVAPPLRILLVTASPSGYIPLQVEEEVDDVLEALTNMEREGMVKVEPFRHAGLLTLRTKVLDFQPHVVHFIGHGMADREGGYLVLEKPDGTGQRVSGSKLASVLSTTSSVRLVLLNACLTARGAGLTVDDFYQLRHALLGIGPALIGVGLGAVIAMQFSMRDQSARAFAEDFYQSLARLRPVDEAVWLGRQRLMLEFDEEQRDWATPVLFLRSRDGVIFRRS